MIGKKTTHVMQKRKVDVNALPYINSNLALTIKYKLL